MRLLLLAAVLLLIVPSAWGQGAPPPELTIQADQETLVVSRERDAFVTLTVSFQSDNPIDTVRPRRVQVEASQVPEGWSIVVSPATASATAEASTTFTATVTLGAGARQSEVPVTFTARLARQFEGNPTGDITDPEATAQVQVTLKREDPLTREVLENVGAWIWALLGGLAILAVVLAVVLARGNRPVVSLSSAIRRVQVAPGRSVAVPVVVENLTGMEDNVAFHVAPMREGWSATLPVPDLPLDGRRREELHLVVTAPKDARAGDAVQVGLTAHGAQNPKRPAELVIDIEVVEGEAQPAAATTSTTRSPRNKERS